MSVMASDLVGRVVAIAVSEAPDQDATGEIAVPGEKDRSEEQKEPVLLRPRLVRL